MPWAGIATAGLCAYLASYTALAGWLAARWTSPRSWRRAVAAGAAWTATEWARSWVFTGFPWLSLGYSQLPGSPLAGYAPAGGVFMVTLAVTLCSAALALAVDAFAAAAPRRGANLLVLVAVIGGGGAALGRIDWTAPVGAPVTVSLVQGNVAQDLKFDPDFMTANFELYTDLVTQSRGRLIVLPESAFPIFADEMPERMLRHLFRAAEARDGDVLVGLFTVEPPLPGRDEPRYYNSVVSLGAADVQLYRKRHLVPFGETIPLESVVGWFIRSVLAIPLASQTSGADDQPPLAVAGQRVAVNICYEDAFGADCGPRRRTPRCSSTSPTTPGTDIRSPRSSTTRSRRCARSKPAARCCARPTPASPRRSTTTVARWRGCRGSRAAFSRSKCRAGRV